MGYFRLNFSREQSLELMDEPDRRLLLADEQMRIAPVFTRRMSGSISMPDSAAPPEAVLFGQEPGSPGMKEGNGS